MTKAADLRQIILTKIPDTIERLDMLCRIAGRDGEPSTCALVIDPRAEFRERNRAWGIQPSFAAIKALTNELFHHTRVRFPAGLHSLVLGRRLVLNFDLYDEDHSFAYWLLESSIGFIKMLGRQYASCEFEVVPGHDSALIGDTTPTGLTIIKHSVQLQETGRFRLDILHAASHEGLAHFVELTAKMNSLESIGHIKIYPRRSLLIFRLDQVPEAGAETELVARWLHKQLLERHEAKAREKRQVRDVLFGKSCISAAIASHFGAQLPLGKVRCGRCSFCLDGKRAETRRFAPREVNLDKINAVLAETRDRKDPRFLARIAIGLHSPRVKNEGLHLNPTFGSMSACRFEVSHE